MFLPFTTTLCIRDPCWANATSHWRQILFVQLSDGLNLLRRNIIFLKYKFRGTRTPYTRGSDKRSVACCFYVTHHFAIAKYIILLL